MDLGTSVDMDIASRILIVSSTIENGKEFVEKLKSLASPLTPTPSSSNPSFASASGSTDLNSPTSPQTIPWLLSNRYYTAPVHFYILTVDDLIHSKTDPPAVPAVVYVFRKDQAEWEREAGELARVMKLGGDEGGGRSEVVLGVRIGSTHPTAKGDKMEDMTRVLKQDERNEEEEDENARIDSTLMALGFEYVDATRDAPVDKLGKRLGADEDSDGDLIPSLPRVLDALSTIMWPSMRSPQSKKGEEKGSQLMELSLNGSFDTDGEGDDDERDKMMRELLEDTAAVSLGGHKGEEESQEREEEELMKQMKAFVEGQRTGAQPQPWILTADLKDEAGVGMTMSPTTVAAEGDEDLLTPFGQGKDEGDRVLKNKVSLKFEDDFSEFIEAPAVQSQPSSSITNDSNAKKKSFFMDLKGANDTLQWDLNRTPTIPPSGYATAGGLTPSVEREASFGNRYRSLGSVSDFGEPDVEDENEGVPAEQLYEALEDVGDSNPSSEHGDEDEEGLPTREEVRDTARQIYGPSLGSHSDRGQGEFDLDRTFGTIQQMKQEIGNIADDEERRRSAVRVALGVVYGL